MRSAPPFIFVALMVAMAAPAAENGATMSFTVPDVTLRNQDGQRVSVYSDLIRDKIVVMNFVFTSCTTVCSPMGANFGQLQSHLGPDVRLISVSIDPATDTPARLKRWSSQFHAGPSWTLLTGDSGDVERLLKALGVYTADRFSHSPVMLIGDGRNGRWLRGNGLAPPDDVLAMIRRVETAGP